MNSRLLVALVVFALPLACSAQSTTAAATSGVPDQASLSSATPQSDDIVGGRLVHKEDPKYPKEARKQRLQGQVVLKVTVAENGKVSSASAISGNSSLGDAALKAVHKWRFEPFTRQGHVVSVQENLIFDFDPSRKVAEIELPLHEPKLLESTTESHPPITIRNSRAGALTDSASPRASSQGVAPAPGVYRVGGGVSAPRVLYSPDPEYSDEARRAKYQGVCVLSVIVGPDGLPRDIRVARSLGMGLDEKAVEAVLKWKFQPSYLNGKPVAVAINIQVMFRL